MAGQEQTPDPATDGTVFRGTEVEETRPPSYSSVGGLCVRPGPQAPGVLTAYGSGPRMGTAAPLVSGAWADSRSLEVCSGA